MKLFVDIGNTAIKWASEDDLREHVSYRTSSQGLPEGIDQAWSRMPRQEEVHIASVRQRKVLEGLTDWIVQRWQASVRVSETRERELGVVNGYRTPSQLGVDRWLALLAARAISSAPVLVVDCGSATTIDAVGGGGRHLGGLILPGLKLFPKCLYHNTDLPEEASGGVLDSFGTDTATGIQSGAMLAHISMVEKALRSLEAKEGCCANCILTGGDAALLTKHLKIAHQVVPDLVLQGLALQSATAK